MELKELRDRASDVFFDVLAVEARDGVGAPGAQLV